jgi:hypothetical protein
MDTPFRRNLAAGVVSPLVMFLACAPGRLLVRAYYRLSPPLARAVASQPLLAAGVRALLGTVAVGADFAMDRPAIAVGLAGVGLAVIVGLGVMSTAPLSSGWRSTA